jgi:hypothetical protein
MNNNKEPFDIGVIIAITGLILSGIYFIVMIIRWFIS